MVCVCKGLRLAVYTPPTHYLAMPIQMGRPRSFFTAHLCKTRVQRHYESHRPQYQKMVLEAEGGIALIYFILAGFFSWLLLAGFLISPSTYASVRDLEVPAGVGKSIFDTVRHLPLAIIASVACALATIGMLLLWWIWRHNYVWICRCLVVCVFHLHL